MTEHDVLNNIHGEIGKMEPLEEEIYESYKKAVDGGSFAAVYNYQKEWLDRPGDLDILVHSEKSAIRIYVAEAARDKDLDVLVDDPDWQVRMAVLEQGRDQDILKLRSDPDPRVRREAEGLETDSDIEKQAHSTDPDDRAEVAERGLFLDELVNDPAPLVRYEVAWRKRDQDLDILVSDPVWQVRAAVAEQGRAKDLKILMDDEDPEVREAAREKAIDLIEQLEKLQKRMKFLSK